MNTAVRKITLLKWLFLPIIIFARLVVIQTERLILYVSFFIVSGIYEINQMSDRKIITIADLKVRMNN